MYSFKSGIKPVYVKDVGIFSVPVINDSSYDKEEIDFNDYGIPTILILFTKLPL